MKRFRNFILFAAIGFSSPLLADVIHLNDGSTFNGEIKKTNDGWLVVDAAGKRTIVPSDQVKSIELTPRGDPKDAAMGKLLSLRRSVDALGDIKTIIERFERFVDQNKGLPAGAEAKKDLDAWKDRQAKGMVKAGGKWVLPEEKAGLSEKAILAADQARELLKQNRLKDAETAINNALLDDPANVPALYLKGLILYRQDQIQPARKAFESVKEASPDHGPTLNNLAVILWRQNQQVGALNFYLAAMQAMPLNKDLLNNVAEALNALPDDLRKGQVPQKVFKLWTEQDTQLQQKMMPLGFYRWGATWVDKAQHEKLQVVEKEIKDKIAKMETDFAEAQAKLDTIDARMQENRDAMVHMERSRYAYNAQNQLVSYPLPAIYWDYDRAIRKLETQRKEALALVDALRAKAQVIRQQFPVPKYTGVQVMVGVEGTPVLPPTGIAAKPPVDKVDATPKPVTDITIGPGDPGTPGNLLEQIDPAKPAMEDKKPATELPKEGQTPNKPVEKPLKY